MKELDWTRNFTVVLDMKSQIRHFREQLGFEVPPPPNLSSSVQLELAISLSSCNLSSPDSPSSAASQHQPLNTFAIHVVARVCGLCSPSTCLLVRCSQSFRSLVSCPGL
jgi:hypothetical protein